jgi:hypothetical protein
VCECSWRVPFTAGVGPLSIVVSQDLGHLGTKHSNPVVVNWHWYYHVPSLGLWSVLAALLILVRSNHCLQAWLIVLPVLAVQLGWSMLARLLSLPAGGAESFGGVLVALAASWAAVWLLASWLARRRILAGLALALGLMAATGSAYFLTVYDLGSMDQAVFTIVSFLGGALTLLGASALAAFSCRRWSGSKRFHGWLLLWTVASTVLLPMIATVSLVGTMLLGGVLVGMGPFELVTMLVSLLFASLIGGGLFGAMLYLVNLPFSLLAKNSPFYRERFHDALRLVSAPAEAVVTSPFADLGTMVDPVPLATAEES